jgi:hypothetical protein
LFVSAVARGKSGEERGQRVDRGDDQSGVGFALLPVEVCVVAHVDLRDVELDARDLD